MVVGNVLGICVCLAGNVCSAIGTIWQKKSIDDHRCDGESMPPLWKRPLWVLGLALVVLASLMDFVALIFSEVYVVCLLATTHIVLNAPLAAHFLNESVSIKRYVLVAVVALASGVALYGTEVVGGKESSEVQGRAQVESAMADVRYWGYLTGTYVAGLTACALIRALSPRYVWLRYGWGLAAALFSSNTVVAAKLLMEMFASANFHDPAFYGTVVALLVILLASCLLQIRFLTTSMECIESEVTASCVFEAAFVITGIVAGAVTLSEFNGMNPVGYTMFFVGTTINVVCIAAIAYDEPLRSPCPQGVEGNEPSPSAAQQSQFLIATCGHPHKINTSVNMSLL